MRFSALFALVLLVSMCHVATARSVFYDAPPAFDENENGAAKGVYKRADGPVKQAMVMARLQELLGPEAFTEFDSHGRLSNLQRLG